MRNMKPIIGITPWFDSEKELTFIKKGYLEGINEAGGIAVLLPVCDEHEYLDELLSRLDGVILSGGPDVDPKYYDEYNLPFNQDICPHRDSMELYIAKKAIAINKPIFGICRGIQIMNVAVGGSLYQDIQKQYEVEPALKHSQQAPKWYPTHEVDLLKDSLVYDSLSDNQNCHEECQGDKLKVWVNSFHHQGIKNLADNYIATAWSADGLIEAIEHKEHPFAVGVQWHPELLWQKNRMHLGLFEMLVNAARK